jgi:hypothetical protein
VGIRLLIAAGDAAARPDQVPAPIRSLIDTAGEILVIVPRLPGRLEWISSDTDRANRQADDRLQAVLGHLDELGASASGRVAADDPLLAFDDAIRAFHPDHLLIALRSADRGGWQERGLVSKVEDRFGIPLTVFQLPE